MYLSTLGEIRTTCRQMVLDENRGHADDLFISDFLWAMFINAGIDAFCRGIKGIVDSSTAAACSATVTAGQPVVALHESILGVRDITLDSTGRELQRKSYNEMKSGVLAHDYGSRSSGVNWRKSTGTPGIYIPDMDTSKKIRLYPIPTADDSIWMTVERLPLTVLVNDSDVVDINRQDRMALVHYALHMAYRKDDTEIYNPHKSDSEGLLFDGMVKDARTEKARLTRASRSGGAAYGGIRF